MSEKKTTSKKVHTLTLEDQTKLAQANVKKMEQGKIEVMKVVEGVQGAEKLAELIERGKKNGKLSSSELMDVLENLDLESDQMDKIYDTLENLGIDTVGDDYLPELADDIMPPLEELNEIEELPEEEMVDPNTLVDSFGIDDPVRMYLKEIGKVNLLTPDEEVQLAQDMGAGDAAKEQMEELEQARERETALQAQAEKRRAINRSRTGFDPTPEDFSPRLTDRQLDLLTEHINRIGLFRRDVTRPEVELLLACQLPEPLQTTHNKLLALLLESLSAARFITPKWQRVAGAKGCFLSKLGKPLTAKDLSAAKQMADIIDAKREQQILDCIRALEAAQS